MAGLIQYSTLVPAGKSVALDARGTTIIVRDLPGELEVTARSQKVGSQSGQAYKLTMRKFEKWFTAQEFDRVELRNDSEHDQFAELLIGYGDFTRELTSRSFAAQAWSGGEAEYNVAYEPQVIEIVPRNDQRKRINLYASAFGINRDLVQWAIAPDPSLSSLYVPPLGELADGIMGVWFETTAPFYLCIDAFGQGEEGGSAEIQNETVRVVWFEELYTS